MKFAPVLLLAVAIGTFMALDRLWLHWYTPEESVSSVARSAAPLDETASPTSPALAPAPGATPPPTPVTVSGIRDAFALLWVAGQRATYRVRYDTQSDDGTAGNSYLVFNSAPLARVDTMEPGQPGPSSQLVVDASGETLSCSTTAAGRSCASIRPFDAPLPLAAGPIVFPAPNTFASLNVIEVFPRAIAGVAARCFEVRPTGADAVTAEYCFSRDGVPLYANGPFGVVQASEFSADVTSADFELTTR